MPREGEESMAGRSRYPRYDEHVAALMKRGNLSQIPADRNHTRGSVIEKLKMLGAAEPHKNAGKADPKPFIYRKFNT